jgi:2',3'-cyclic-nucleotide 2'-phosphodiesterase (5'-nucleotidase family)
MMKATGADASMINSGSIRTSIKAGDITGGDLLSALPFSNYAVTVRFSGKQILDVLNSGLGAQSSGKFLQFYGLKVTTKKITENSPDRVAFVHDRVEAVEIGGQPLNLAAEYTVAVNDFMVGGGNAYKTFARAEKIREFTPINAMFMEFMVKTRPEVMNNPAASSRVSNPQKTSSHCASRGGELGPKKLTSIIQNKVLTINAASG